MTNAATMTMAFAAPDVTANFFHSMGYATRLGGAIDSGRRHWGLYWDAIRLDSLLGVMVRDIQKADFFDPNAAKARQAADFLEYLTQRLSSMLVKAEQAQLRNHALHKYLFDSIAAKTQTIEIVTESWELALNPKFGKLVDEAVKSLDLSSKSTSDWRTSLANLQD